MQTAKQLNALLAVAEESRAAAAELQVAACRALAELPAQIDEVTQCVRRETGRIVIIGMVAVFATALVLGRTGMDDGRNPRGKADSSRGA